MAYDPTLMPSMSPQQGPRPATPMMSTMSPGSGMPTVTSPMGGVANMVKALMDGNQQYGQQHPGMPPGGQAPGAPLSLAPPQDPTSPMDPTKMGGGMPPAMGGTPPMAVNPANMAGGVPMPMPRPSMAPQPGMSPQMAQQPPMGMDPATQALMSPMVAPGGQFGG